MQVYPGEHAMWEQCLKIYPAIQKSHGIELSTVREKVRSLQGQKNIDYSLRN